MTGLASAVLDLGASTSRGIFQESCSSAERLNLINNLGLFRNTVRFIVIPRGRRMLAYSALFHNKINAYDLRDSVIGVKGIRDDDCNGMNWENTEMHEAMAHVTFYIPACNVKWSSDERVLRSPLDQLSKEFLNYLQRK